MHLLPLIRFRVAEERESIPAGVRGGFPVCPRTGNHSSSANLESPFKTKLTRVFRLWEQTFTLKPDTIVLIFQLFVVKI